MKAIRAGIAEVLHEKRIYLYGNEITETEVSGFCLPALLLSVASIWTSPDNAKSKKAYFAFDMTTDNAEVLMFRVSHLSTSSSRALKSAVVKSLRQTKCGDTFVLDSVVDNFSKSVEELRLHVDALLDHRGAWLDREEGKIYTVCVPQ